MGEELKGLIDQSSEVLSKAYDDIIHPSAEPVGQMLSYLPRTARLALAKWEKWIVNGEESLKLTGAAIREKVDKIPEDKLCEPELYVAVPLIQQIAYCYNSEELRNMYANLLAASMNSDRKWEVHPGYVDIIKQLTPDEAKLLQNCPRNSMSYVPLINLTIVLPDGKGTKTIKRHYTNRFDNWLDYPQNISRYLDNLYRLKLIHIPGDGYLSDDNHYKPLIDSEFVGLVKSEIELDKGEKFDYDKKMFYVTEFGLGFIECCIDE